MTAQPGGPAGEGVLAALPAEHRGRLMALARDTAFPGATRIFEEGEEADRFWIIRSGTVALDVHVPGRGPAVVETVGAGGLLGWSWLCPPRLWHLGAETREPVRAWEFEAAPVRDLCAHNPALGLALVTVVAETIGDRLRATRTRLLDLYEPRGAERSGTGP
ncbi:MULTISPECIES: cyclic nucleotide-binding domain-containing protein [Streptomyces]|uniref:Cyclic nucleotide-binding domain-containing protein n=1 Tax=Streptomyces tirandamycinicus TaxID=2174846 RepID=A0A2S1SM09_9ACTN|nr:MULTISPECIES: cyclic nucleotide-binding domain-containing protein [Streptomyces]AWI27455.1 cyclic nucleotide-binding domain-containing protein [Streptomyces tirandamycinicus]MCY0982727.1 cyclic nucleotide-binding domain-containing protein [Streptomyces tirandamycinicus]NNJ05310.1 cyclic nucleotide-binding domain-containing protein [Streptomyces sp. PKU-MA01144]